MKTALGISIAALITALLFSSCNRGIPASAKPDETTAPHEHNYILSDVPEKQSLFNGGTEIYRCDACGGTMSLSLPAADAEALAMPILRLSGTFDGISKENEVTIGFEYKNGDEEYTGTAKIKHQGASSLQYPKKNYTIKLYSDANVTKKYKIDFGFGKESKYCLKANYIDFTQARNVVSAKIFADIVRSRKSVDENLVSAPNMGVVDGFPIIIYINDDFNGIYTLNIPKDDWMFGMGKSETEAILMADAWGDSTAFRTPIADISADGWDLEYCSTDDERWVTESFNRLINFIIDNNGEDFRRGIGQYLDVEAAIDTMLFTYYIDGSDNTSKNTLYVTYDGIKWIPSMYDMDSVFGLHYYGELKEIGNLATIPQISSEGMLNLATPNLLYRRLFENFKDEVICRYRELRGSVMSDESVLDRFDTFMAAIPSAAYESDRQTWEDIPSADKNNREFLSEYISTHSKMLDEFFDKFEKAESFTFTK